MSSFWERHFRPAAAVLLLGMAVAQVASMRTESQTYDESYHLLCGYTYLRTGGLPPYSEHPPLSQIAAAWPLLFLDLRIPETHPDRLDDERRREQEFLYHSAYPANTLLLLARSAHLLITLLLAALIGWWTMRRFGPAAGLAALWLFTFDPNFLAHGRYVTTDVPAAACFLLGCLAWNQVLADGRLTSAAICGVGTGLAMVTKYSAVLLLFTYVLTYVVCRWRQPSRFSPWGLAKNMAVVGAVMFLVVYTVFGFETRSLLMPDSTVMPESLSARLTRNPGAGGPLGDMIVSHPLLARMTDRAALMPVPAPSFFRGLYSIRSHVARGHPTFLLGSSSETGWWYYFPVIAAVKTPTGDILLFLLAVAVSAFSLFRGGLRAAFNKCKSLRIDWYILTLPPLVYFAAAIYAHINLGVRHLLPVYPFVFIWMAAVLFRAPGPTRFVRLTAVACLGLVALESMLAFPHYIAFFNIPSGGVRAGSRIAVDSNLDWGQDLNQVKPYLSAHGISNVCLAYFGIAPPEYYGIVAQAVPSNLADARASGCVVVISLSLLLERNFNGRYDWLLRLRPAGSIGNSFRVYEPGSASIP